jgi:hypothetical protein
MRAHCPKSPWCFCPKEARQFSFVCELGRSFLLLYPRLGRVTGASTEELSWDRTTFLISFSHTAKYLFHTIYFRYTIYLSYKICSDPSKYLQITAYPNHITHSPQQIWKCRSLYVTISWPLWTRQGSAYNALYMNSTERMALWLVRLNHAHTPRKVLDSSASWP